MAGAEIVTATLEHAAELAPQMRAADAAEVLASGGYTPLAALEASVKGSPYARTLLVGGRVAALFGVGPCAQPAIGVVWLLTGELVERHRKTFLRLCRPEIARMLELYPTLVNAVDARYVRSVEWLRRLGFEITAPQPYGVAQLPFHFFVLRRESFHV